ncbi:hypothetical protein PTKIN_Ptkin09bG0006100 [Pterospermum kingtungense]
MGMLISEEGKRKVAWFWYKGITKAIYRPQNASSLSQETRHLEVYSDKKLVEKTCRNTFYFDLCVSTLKSDPRSSSADVAGLAHIAADSVEAKATATLNQITGLLKTANDPNLQKALQSCVDSYTTIKTAIEVAITEIVRDNPKFVVNMANDAAAEAEICEVSFADPPKSPISGSNEAVHDLSSVLASIASLLL